MDDSMSDDCHHHHHHYHTHKTRQHPLLAAANLFSLSGKCLIPRLIRLNLLAFAISSRVSAIRYWASGKHCSCAWSEMQTITL
jgi:hypothetical protein